ncbi:hypothetical protein NQ318_000712 [Aromia moschata]|uniref:Uncharacterized protein n=1 Tax=Aromia moschata TaxID=1265417 RepID=A0AAV8XSS5_9CUCU|nr:hypothetical protein NQ318_000712 [Aromia moschata]
MSGSGAGGGAAALRAAANAGDVAACQRYLGSARCVRFSRDEEGRSALHLAASGGHGAVVRLLLNVAAPREVDSPDGAGCTALQRAAADGHEEVLRLLLARGADVDRQDSLSFNSDFSDTARVILSFHRDFSFKFTKSPHALVNICERSMIRRATFKGLNKYGTCFVSQSSRPPPHWPSYGHLEYGIPIRGRLKDGRYPRLLF